MQKPWNPYIQRHTALTEKARILKEYNLRQYAGWTKTSQMIEIYTHDLGGESSKELLAAYGIIDSADPQREAMQPRICPACKEPNKHDARFCANKECEMPLTLDSYQEVKEREKQKEKEAEEDRRRLHEVYQAMYERGWIKDKSALPEK